MNKGKRSRTVVRLIEVSLTLAVVSGWYCFGYYSQRSVMEAKPVSLQATEGMTENTGGKATEDTEEGTAGTSDSSLLASGMFAENRVEWQGKKYRRNTYIKAILCMGVDQKGGLNETTHALGGRADGLFLIVQDTARNQFKVLMIPRDTMTPVTITDLRGNVVGKDLHHLTVAYSYGDGREQSCEYVVEAASGLLGGLQIDHYLAIDMEMIGQVNDAVGGVTVTVPTEGMEKRDPAFIKGASVTLHGDQAEKFIRYRNTEEGNSALYRMDQHQEYIKGFFQAVKRTARSESGIVEHLFNIVQDHMITDMSKAEYLKIGTDALGMGGLEDEDIFTIPGYGITGEALYDEFYAEESELIPLILKLFYREDGNSGG